MENTYNCEPTLNDTQVLEFCKQGFLMLKGVVPDEVNQRTFAFLDAHPSGTPSEILQEDWFVENVICCPQAVGAIRSVLGKSFRLPGGVNNHRAECPASSGGWHFDSGGDGAAVYGPEFDLLQVFYYPQDAQLEMGPTEVLPGSHFLFCSQTHMQHYCGIRGAVSTAAPAGSIFITIWGIWHRRTVSTACGTRNLLKYEYSRTALPARDWIREPTFEVRHAKSSPPGLSFHREHHRTINDAAELFYWLCGQKTEYHAGKKPIEVRQSGFLLR